MKAKTNAKATVKAAETAAKKQETAVKAETAKAEAVKAEAAKTETVKAAEEVKKAETKTAAKTAAKTTAKKAPAKKAPAKKAAAVKETVYLQYYGKEINKDDLVARVKEVWAENHAAADLKSVNLYLKPEENAAYYVVNDSFSGKLDF